jgi:hypothetical protein
MLLRLLLVLLLAFAAPAMPMASCHDGPAMAMTRHEIGGARHRQPVQAEHLCVGCTAVADWNAARIAPPIMLPAPMPVATIAPLMLLPGEAPAPPPPRMA